MVEGPQSIERNAAVRSLEDQLRRDPEDWEGWRVYADWLIDHGDPRGELTHLHLRLATEQHDPAEIRALQEHLREQIRALRPSWIEGLGVPPRARLVWRPGFVVGAQVRSAEANDRGDRQRVLEALSAMLAHPTARFFSSLALGNAALDAEVIPALLDTPLRDRVLRLELTDGRVGDEGVAAVAELSDLRELRLARNDISARGVAALGGGRLCDLVGLDLSDNYLATEGAEALAAAALPGLARVGLARTHIRWKGVRALGGSRSLTGLVAADLSDNALGDWGVADVASADAFANLRELDLRANHIGDRGAEMLAHTDVLCRLERLDLRDNDIGPEGLAALLDSPALRSCQILR